MPLPVAFIPPFVGITVCECKRSVTICFEFGLMIPLLDRTDKVCPAKDGACV